MSRRIRDKTPITLEVTALSHEGRGIAKLTGKTVFVAAALPGETVLAQYTKGKQQYDEARVVEIVNASPQRITPRCEYFDTCGGCSMQHLSQADQIQHKQHVLLEQLQHYANTQPATVLPPLITSPWHYRRKARLGVRYVHNKGMLIGFREKYHPNMLTNMQHCDILDPSIAKLLPELRDVLSSLSCKESIPQLEVSVGDNASSLVLRHLVSLLPTDIELLQAFGAKHDIRICLQPRNEASVHCIWPDPDSLLLSYQLPEYNCRLEFHPCDFTQVNAKINHLMLQQAITLLEPNANDRILDLFCGLGNFSLPLARKAQHVIGVEGSQQMVDRAKANAVLNHMTNVEFYAADLTADFTRAPWAKQTFNKILIDPPRTGAIEIIKHLPYFAAQRIVYVSCNPATLARDTAALLQQGYTLVSAGVMDMFSHTSHVESIALFTK